MLLATRNLPLTVCWKLGTLDQVWVSLFRKYTARVPAFQAFACCGLRSKNAWVFPAKTNARGLVVLLSRFITARTNFKPFGAGTEVAGILCALVWHGKSGLL